MCRQDLIFSCLTSMDSKSLKELFLSSILIEVFDTNFDKVHIHKIVDKGTEFLPQILILQSPYLRNLMV